VLLHGILGYSVEGEKARYEKTNLAPERRLAKLFCVQETNQNEILSQLPYLVAPTIAGNEPSPNNPPWTSLTAVGVWIASVAFILIVPSLFLLPYLLTRTPPITQADQIVEFAKSDPTSIFLQIAAIVPAHILTLLLAWVVATHVRKYPLRKTLGFDKGGFAWWHYCIILGGFFAVAAVVGLYFPEQENDLIRILKSSRAAVFIVAFVATFTAPIAEEIVYRGILYSAFQRSFGVVAGFILVTLLFALVHVPQYYPSYSTIFLLTLLSVILTLIRVKSGNLLPCIILHTIFNGFQSALLILEPYFRTPDVPQTAALISQLLH